MALELPKIRVYMYALLVKEFSTGLFCVSLALLLYPHHKMWVGGYTGFALSRRSVRPSPIRVSSITPLLMEGFPSNLNDTFTSTRGCAEPMLPMCQLKVKVTVKCQINQNKIYIHLKTL